VKFHYSQKAVRKNFKRQAVLIYAKCSLIKQLVFFPTLDYKMFKQIVFKELPQSTPWEVGWMGRIPKDYLCKSVVWKEENTVPMAERMQHLGLVFQKPVTGEVMGAKRKRNSSKDTELDPGGLTLSPI
jgi:hypothetical protein